jgi:methylthioribose-1-phosphate isomerase
MFKTIEWTSQGRVRLLDQTRLPQEKVYIDCRHYREVAQAIKTMKIRGAPAIGVAAALGVALAAKNSQAPTREKLQQELKQAIRVLAATRPTAKNLFWALDRMQEVIKKVQKFKGSKVQSLKAALVTEAQKILKEDIAVNQALGKKGAVLIKNGARVLTHCNAGALATAGYGTALGVIRAAHAQRKKLMVWVDETRPYLQGARLTAWELLQDKIPATLLTDNMAGWMMKQGEVDLIIVGADRIARNGDTANKIGTYSLAVLAKENKIPFYVAAPLSTIDLTLSRGEDIPIEERSSEEVIKIGSITIAPKGIKARHPAFDVTPAKYITAIITEKGIAKAPYGRSLNKLFE